MIDKLTFCRAILLMLLPSLFFSSCLEIKEKKHHRKDKEIEKVISDITQNVKYKNTPDASACDPNIWKYVYNPIRLEVVNACMTVTGIIKESSADDDGDQHMLLMLDAGQENLLKKKNIKKKNGYLVIEAVCINNITLPKVAGACKGYANHVQILGAHVKVTGSYVIDSHNGWAEIHPISKIEVIN